MENLLGWCGLHETGYSQLLWSIAGLAVHPAEAERKLCFLETICHTVLLPAGSELDFPVHCTSAISHILESIFQEQNNFC